MPTFCRHGRFIERCPVCSPRGAATAAADRGAGGSAAVRSASASARGQRRASTPRRDGLRVRRETRADDDGFRSPLAAGLRSAADAERLAQEVGFAAGRLLALSVAPPGLYADVAAQADLEQATWLAFLIAYLVPRESDDPFAAIRAATTDWHSGELPDLQGVALGPHTSHDPARGSLTLAAYRTWVQRTGSQARALAGDPDWSPERRFERIFERLALPGLSRSARYDLLVTLGRLGRYDLRGPALYLGGEDEATLAAKRVFGIGDPQNLERRAAALAQAADVPVEALDLALANWGSTRHAGRGLPPVTMDPAALSRTRAALVL